LRPGIDRLLLLTARLPLLLWPEALSLPPLLPNAKLLLPLVRTTPWLPPRPDSFLCLPLMLLPLLPPLPLPPPPPRLLLLLLLMPPPPPLEPAPDNDLKVLATRGVPECDLR